ncbi:hypothetical protein D770_12520 [Flammeovirgaceae bacterium 311]|nr:hypothetical protein D770_12520 [Flammeovirgaceae bacterium 311]
MKFYLLITILVLPVIITPKAYSQQLHPFEARVTVDFSDKLRDWDGFGVNYVETSRTHDYRELKEDYSGFSYIDEPQRQEIIELIFGEDGLKPSILKMFLDPFQEGYTEQANDNKDPFKINKKGFDHFTTNENMLYFARNGVKTSRARGADIQIITTLYGPPGWMTRQKIFRGRDLDPAYKYELAEYMIAWAKFLKEDQKLPLMYLSIHNEGDHYVRWPMDAQTGYHNQHDHNMYWSPAQVVDFVKFMRPMMNKMGLSDVGLTPGECSDWYKFIGYGYAPALYEDEEALNNLAILTSHGFIGDHKDWFGDWRSDGNDLIRLKKPQMHSWVTSMTWGSMNLNFLEDVRRQIYDAKVNALIPWATVNTERWWYNSPNVGTAIRIREDKNIYFLEPGYYLYKHVSRAGQSGMAVANVLSDHDQVKVIAFSANGSNNPDAFTIINNNTQNPAKITITLKGAESRDFEAFETHFHTKWSKAGDYKFENNTLTIEIPQKSVTTFYGVKN